MSYYNSDELIKLINNCKQHCEQIKKIYNFHVQTKYSTLPNLTFDDNINAEQQKLISDICDNVLANASKGKNNVMFDLQYTNPHKDWYKPGLPLTYLFEDSHKWFTNLGFETKNILSCCNVSTSCEFVCQGDAICKVLIKWNNTGIDIKNDNIFNAQFCSNIAIITKNLHGMLKI